MVEWADEAELKVTEGVTVREIEDLVPVNVAVPACRRYAKTFLGLNDDETKKFKDDAVTKQLTGKNGSLWDALESAFTETFEAGLGKAGFAKELLAHISESKGSSRPPGVPALDDNFAALLRRLADTLQTAREHESDDRRDRRLDRIIETFSTDYPSGCTRDRANTTLKSIDTAVDDTAAGDIVQSGTARLRREFKLTAEPLKNVENYSAFLEALTNLRYRRRLADQGAADFDTNGASKK
jgi:hypothetical protein